MTRDIEFLDPKPEWLRPKCCDMFAQIFREGGRHFAYRVKPRSVPDGRWWSVQEAIDEAAYGLPPGTRASLGLRDGEAIPLVARKVTIIREGARHGYSWVPYEVMDDIIRAVERQGLDPVEVLQFRRLPDDVCEHVSCAQRKARMERLNALVRADPCQGLREQLADGAAQGDLLDI